MRAKYHRPLVGEVKTCCVRRTSTGKWFVTFVCELEAQTLPASDAVVGLDMRLEKFATLLTGEPIANPRFVRCGERALAKVQRRLAKHPKPGKGERQSPARHKAKKAVGHVHERIAHQRADFAHQRSRQLVNTYGIICVEDLSINRMVHNHCLAKSIHDAAWRQFIAAMTYKAEWAGRRVAAVSPAYTSQDCSGCGHREPKDLGERVHRCSCCGLVLHRDHNAALNILRVGLHSLAQA